MSTILLTSYNSGKPFLIDHTDILGVQRKKHMVYDGEGSENGAHAETSDDADVDDGRPYHWRHADDQSHLFVKKDSRLYDQFDDAVDYIVETPEEVDRRIREAQLRDVVIAATELLAEQKAKSPFGEENSEELVSMIKG